MTDEQADRLLAAIYRTRWQRFVYEDLPLAAYVVRLDRLGAWLSKLGDAQIEEACRR